MAAVVGDTDVRSEADMQERSAAIYNYLEEKYSSGNLIGDDTEFFKNHPEYMMTASENDEKPELIESKVLNTDLMFRTQNIDEDTKLTEVDFYSDGSYIISVLEKDVVSSEMSLNSNKISLVSAYSSIVGKNTHEIYNGLGQHVGRSFVEAYFNYNGTTVSCSQSGANVRCLL